MRTTLTIDDDVAEAARSLTRATGKPLGKVVSELMRKALQPTTRTRASNSRVPTFAVSKKAGVIPAGRASRLLADER